MAYLILNNGKTASLPADKGADIWLVLNGYEEGTEAQQEYCTKIKSIHLNWRNAPEEWIRDNLETYIEKAKDEWYVNRQGKPTRPQYTSDWNIKKKWNIT